MFKLLTCRRWWRFNSTGRQGAAVLSRTLHQCILEADYRVWRFKYRGTQVRYISVLNPSFKIKLLGLSTDQIETSLWGHRRSPRPCWHSLPEAYRCHRYQSQPPDQPGGSAEFALPHLPSPPSGSSRAAQALATALTAEGSSPAWLLEAEWATPGGRNIFTKNNMKIWGSSATVEKQYKMYKLTSITKERKCEYSASAKVTLTVWGI